MRRADLFQFRKVFLLLLAMVCLPSFALSIFGILAIKNERAAAEKHVEEIYASRLESFREALEADPSLPFLRGPALDEAVDALGRRLFPDEKARFRVASEEELAAERRAGHSVLASLASAAELHAFGPVIAERPLAGRLAGRVLVAHLGDVRDPANVALVNRVWYVILLVVLYAAIVVGVVLTSRAVYREAKLSRLKSDFVSHVSHELRTPLTSIRLFVETLRLGRFRTEGERTGLMEHLDEEAARLAVLVDRLLDWARMESGKKVYRRTPTPAAELAKEALAVFERQGLIAPGLVDLVLDPSLPDVEVDREAITVVLVNLLANAYKYTGAEKVIRLRVKKAGKRVFFEVQDNGPGIPASERKRIFDHFYRVDDLLTRRAEGTGLGLAIAKRITEDHGGRIEIAGEIGRGSRFTVVLPTAERPNHA